MDRAILLVHLVTICSLDVRVCDSSSYAQPAAVNNGHTAKKSPMDYSLYAADERKITNHGQMQGLHKNMCDSKYTLKNSTIIRTSESLKFGAIFVGNLESVGPSECRWYCCQKEKECDTAIFNDDNSKTKNCFMFKCWHEEELRCKFSVHGGYISSVIGGFDKTVGLSVPNGVVGKDEANSDINNYDGDSTNGNSDKKDADGKNADDESESTGSAKETSGVDGDACQSDQIHCASGECIAAHYICNDIDDCLDGSDEMGCKYDTNTPSSHSSLATNLPNLGPTTQQDAEKPRVTQKMNLQEVRSELANELDGQQEHSRQKEVDKEGVHSKPVDERKASGQEDHSTDDDDNKDGKANEQHDNNNGGSKVGTQSRDKPTEMHAPESNMGAHQDRGQEKLSGGKSEVFQNRAGNERGKIGLKHADSTQENIDKQTDRQVDESRQVVGQSERFTNSMETHLQPGSNGHRTGEKEEDTTNHEKEGNGYGRYDDGTSHILDQAPGEAKDKDHRLAFDHSRDRPGYDPPRRPNPPITDMSNSPGLSDRFSPNYYRSDETKDNTYPYDTYGAAYRKKPYTSQQDYNYDDDMFRDLPRAGRNYPDELYEDNPVYQDLAEANPNYHQQNGLNAKYNNYPTNDRHVNREPSQRRHQYEGSPEHWDQRGGDSNQRGDRPRVGGRPHDEKLGPDDGSSNNNQQDRPGAWKQWNNFNHRVDPWDDDHNANRYDDTNGDADNRLGDTDVGETQQGVKPGQDWRTGDDDKPEVTVDKKGSPENDNTPKTTERIVYKGTEELADSPTTQSSQQSSKLKQPKTAFPETTNEDKDHIVGIATQAGDIKSDDIKSDEVVKPETDIWDPPHKNGGAFGHPAASAVLPLAVGLVITLLLLLMLSCRLRYMNRRLRYGRLKTHAHDADYLINGMYL